MTEPIAPMTTPEMDLRGFPGFMLDVERLLASELVALGTGDEIAAAMMLWCRAWQQSPPGSLPNEDRVLAAFSKAKNWSKVRAMALRGFVLCSDGRLYHKFVCQQAHDAWDRRKRYREKQEREADRLRKWREKKQAGNAGSNVRIAGDDDVGNAYGNADGNVGGNVDETRFKARTKRVREGEGKEKGSKPVNPSGTDVPGGDPPPGLAPNEALFQIGVPWLVSRGCKDSSVRSLLGGAVKKLGAEGAWAMVSECMREGPIEPIAWLAAGLNERMRSGGAQDEKRSGKGGRFDPVAHVNRNRSVP